MEGWLFDLAVVYPVRRLSVMTDLQQCRADILRIAEEHGARNVRVFGSNGRGDAGPNSDLDLLEDMDHVRIISARSVTSTEAYAYQESRKRH